MWICKVWWMTKANAETLKTKCFLPDCPKNVTKDHDESLSFDYPIYLIKHIIYIIYLHNFLF